MAAVALAFFALLVPAAEAAKKLPDLRPTEAGFNGKQFAFIGKPLRVSVTDTTYNKGSAKAGPTLTRAFLQHGGDRRRLGEHAVGALRPNRRDVGESDARGTNEFPAGAYKIVVCADAKDQVKESNERNNCGRVTSPPSFYSVYEQWEGSINGTGPGLFGTQETWRPATDASFGFDGYLGGGLFSWKVDGGAVKYTTAGSGAGCSYNGSGTFALDRRFGQLLLNYDTGTYTASAGPNPGATYTVAENCSGSIINRTAFARPVALLALQQNLPYGSTALKGAFADPAVKGVNYTWNLAGT
jgi:hypothetical protein